MSVLENAKAKAKQVKARVVFPEHGDERIVAAAAILAEQGLAVPVWLSDAKAPATYGDIVCIAKPKLSKEQALELLEKDPSTLAAAMVAKGEAFAMVAGAATATSKVIRAALATVGTAQGVSRASSFFLMSFPDGRELVFADCAVNLAPDAETLADIASASAASCAALMGESRTALLSFSTLGSGAGPSVDMVAQAAALLQARDLDVVGPLQADAALNAAIGQRKGVASGPAFNTLIFPSLDAGNIAYKLCQELAGAAAAGPFLQGFAKPVCDLSRGATVDDIVASTVITVAMNS